MENWAYAGSWENSVNSIKPIKQCTPDSFGGYPAFKTTYDEYSLRSLVYVVGTGEKNVTESSLGTDENIFSLGK